MPSRRLPILLVAAALLLLAAAAAWWRLHPRGPAWVELSEGELRLVRNPHDRLGHPVCQACHRERSDRLLGDGLSTCTGCHPPRGHNHPLDVRVQAPGPGPLPVAPDGTLVCASCHDPHASMRSGHGLRMAFNQLCRTCHGGHA